MHAGFVIPFALDGGPMVLSEGPFWESLGAATRRHIWAAEYREVPIIRAPTEADAGLIGAAAGAWRRFQTSGLPKPTETSKGDPPNI